MAPKSKLTASGQSAENAPEADQTLPATGTAAATADAAEGAPSAADAAVTAVTEWGQRKGPAGMTVVVQGPKEGRWRIGRKFTAEPTSIPAEELTEAMARALFDDPALMVTMIEAPY